MKTEHLIFSPIDLKLHADDCIRFRADSFFVSFGTTEAFHAKDALTPTKVFPGGEGVEEYLDWLEKRMKEIPGSCVHIWQRGEIIGQIEMGRFRLDPSIGYVNLFYLIPECRGKGLGSQLEQFAVDFLLRAGHRAARLCVSPTNLPAVAFYLKHQWQDLGPREDRPEGHYLEKQLVVEERIPALGEPIPSKAEGRGIQGGDAVGGAR
jgi:ribosomal protein S18 acetylase RimI-like enzyme